jgi:RNA polymerase sigma factor for flagellar operon FliA
VIEASDEAHEWAALRQGDQPARERIFLRYSSFAAAIARSHHRRRSCGDLEMGEVKQLAYAGLLEAIDRFDPARGAPFRAYSAARIAGSISDGIARMSEMREQLSWRHRLRRDRLQSLGQDVAVTASTADAMAALAEIAMGLAVGFMLEGSGMVAGDGEADPGDARGYDSAEWTELVRRLKGELDSLCEREQTILRCHYLHDIAFDQIAVLIGVSKGRVSQLHRAALERLRKRMMMHGHFRLER